MEGQDVFVRGRPLLLCYPHLNVLSKVGRDLEGSLPLPPAAWSILRWSTVICRISAFSSLAEPFATEKWHINNVSPKYSATPFKKNRHVKPNIRQAVGACWGTIVDSSLPFSPVFQRRWERAFAVPSGCY